MKKLMRLLTKLYETHFEGSPRAVVGFIALTVVLCFGAVSITLALGDALGTAELLAQLNAGVPK